MLHRHRDTAAARLPVSSDNNYSSTGLKKDIYLAAGCFWGAEHYFKQIRGVVATEAGYANGNIFHPTYEEVKTDCTGYAEAVHVIFDTEVIGLERILQLYFKDLDARKKALLEIPRLFPQCAVSSSLPINIEINATDATKGHALAFLTKHLGLKTEETLAFGDGTNDISMLRQAGIGVAMGNAAPEALAAADRVTASNDEDGLARVLEELGF